jgi:hypothetical protein
MQKAKAECPWQQELDAHGWERGAALVQSLHTVCDQDRQAAQDITTWHPPAVQSNASFTLLHAHLGSLIWLRMPLPAGQQIAQQPSNHSGMFARSDRRSFAV